MDDPVVVFDMGVVADRYRLWRTCFPDIQPFYGNLHYRAVGRRRKENGGCLLIKPKNK